MHGLQIETKTSFNFQSIFLKFLFNLFFIYKLFLSLCFVSSFNINTSVSYNFHTEKQKLISFCNCTPSENVKKDESLWSKNYNFNFSYFMS